MPNIKGPIFKEREVLHGVIQSTLHYGAPVWYSLMNVRTYQDVLTQTERKSILRVASATLSNRALQEITQMTPIQFLANERHRIYDRRESELARSEGRETTLNTWQDEWDMTLDVAQLTKKLIPNIRIWTDGTHLPYPSAYLSLIFSNLGIGKTVTFQMPKMDHTNGEVNSRNLRSKHSTRDQQNNWI